MEYIMLEALYLTKSKIRQDLLTIFFTNPGQKYYLRQLERLLGYSAGSIRRELLKFQRDRLFDTQKIGNILFYYLNSNHPLFEELKSIVFKTTGVEGSLKRVLAPFKEIRSAFIYGSFAAGREKSTSDIDVMIIGDPDISTLNVEIADLELKLKREVQVAVYSWEEYQAKKKAESGFIMDLLNNPIIMLIGQKNGL